MKIKTKIILSAVFAVLFVLLLYSVMNFDVAPIGVNGTEVGLSTLNGAFHELTGVNMKWYDITDIFGILAFLNCVWFGFIGFVQLTTRKNFFKVDGEILALGGLYILTMAVYFGFLKIPVCYRPIIMPDELMPEPSFPSSHTVLITVVMMSTIMMVNRYVKSKTFGIVLKVICTVSCAVTILGRLISGVHWLTDIIGSMLISAGLLLVFSAVLDIIEKNKQ